jgi:hypothetical protein
MDLTRFLAKVFFIIKIPPKLSVKSFVFTAGSDVPLNQAWGYYNTGIPVS